MGVPTLALPDNSASIGYAFNAAMNIVSTDLASVPNLGSGWSVYEMAIYNLAGDFLVNYAPDQVGQTYFSDAREKLGIAAFTAGVIASSSDEGTSQTMTVPDAFKGLTIDDLQRLKTPYGRQYLALAQKYGPSIWGLT